MRISFSLLGFTWLAAAVAADDSALNQNIRAHMVVSPKNSGDTTSTPLLTGSSSLAQIKEALLLTHPEETKEASPLITEKNKKPLLVNKADSTFKSSLSRLTEPTSKDSFSAALLSRRQLSSSEEQTQKHNFMKQVVLPTLMQAKLPDPVEPVSLVKEEDSAKLVVNLEDEPIKNLRDKPVTDFELDVVAPVLVSLKLKETEDDADNDRQLQQTARCGRLEDNSIFCVFEGFPGNGFMTIFFNCILSQGSGVNLLDCLSCVVVGVGTLDELNDAQGNVPQCNSCTICRTTVAFDCVNIAGGDCARTNCNGDCTNNNGVAPTPAPVNTDNDGLTCFRQDDPNLLTCTLEDFPGNGFITIFYNCPIGGTILDCSDCDIVVEDDPQQIDQSDPKCLACDICEDWLALDCSNVVSGECAIQDCQGNCINDGRAPTPPTPQPAMPVPAPTPVEGRLKCLAQDSANVACAFEQFPRFGLVTVFLNCPTFDQATLLDCTACTIYEEKEVSNIDEADEICNSCQVCGNTVALDCTNFNPGVACAAQTCEGQCIGAGPVAPSAPSPRPFGPSTSSASVVGGAAVRWLALVVMTWLALVY